MGYSNRFANFYRIQYVISAIVGLLILLGFFFWDDYKRPEKIRRNALEHCLVDCVLEEQMNKIDEAAKKECLDSCHDKYGEL